MRAEIHRVRGMEQSGGNRRSAAVWLTASPRHRVGSHVLLRAPGLPILQVAPACVGWLDRSVCGGLLVIFPIPLLGKTRLATLR